MEVEATRITVVGMLLILAAVALLALLVHALFSSGGSNPGNSNAAAV
jgi:hypothetical protein